MPDIKLEREEFKAAEYEVPRVFGKNNWDNAWLPAPTFHPQFVNRASPTGRTQSSARLIRRYGIGARADDEEISQHFPQATIGDLIGIEDGDFHFIGTVQVEADRIEGPEDGQQQFVIHGLERELNDYAVRNSVWWDNGNNVFRVAPQGLTFNERGEPNRSATKRVITYFGRTVECYLFDRDGSASNAQYWSTRDIVEYLMSVQTPRSSTSDYVIPFAISAPELLKLPPYDAPVLQCNGIEVGVLLTKLIARSRGFMWFLDYTLDGDNQEADRVDVKVATLTDTTIEDDGQVLIAPNTDTITIDVSDDPSQTTVVVKDKSHGYDLVIAHGAPELYSFTAWGQNLAETDPELRKRRWLIPQWGNDDIAAYNAGGSGNANYPPTSEPRLRRAYTQAARQEEPARAAWRYFRLADNAFGDEFEFETFPPIPNPHIDEGFRPYSTAMANRLGLKLEGNDREFSRTLVWTFEGDDWTDPNVRFRRIEDMSNTNDLPKVIQRKQLTGTLKFRWRNRLRGEFELVHSGGHQHVLALGDAPPFTPIPNVDQVEPVIDWQNLFVTASVESEFRATGFWPQPAPPDIDARRILILEAGDDYVFHWAAPHTAFQPIDTDDESTGPEMQLTGNQGITVRDDRRLLQRIAKLAYQWYGSDRGALVLTTGLKKVPEPEPPETEPPPATGARTFDLGQYVQHIKHGDFETPVESCITSLRIDYRYQEGPDPAEVDGYTKITIRTSWGEFDANQFARANVGGGRR